MLANEIEQVRREELEILQLERLKKVVAWSYDKSAFYRRTFQAHGVTPEEIQSLEDVCKLPLLTREEIRTVDAFEFLTLPLSSVVRINNRDGLTKFFTRGDIRNHVEMMIRCLAAANVLRGSIVGIAGDFTDGRILDALYALESIGATVIPLKDFRLAERFGVDTIITSRELSEVNAAKIFCLNETLIPSPQLTSAKIFNLFAPPELNCAGTIYQCASGESYHVQEDHVLLEIVDGELILTTLTAQAMPLIRFRTGQFVRPLEICSCGRTFKKISAN